MKPCPACSNPIAHRHIWTVPGANICFVDGEVVFIQPIHGSIIFVLLEAANAHAEGKAETPVVDDLTVINRVWGQDSRYSHSPKYLQERVTAIRTAFRNAIGQGVIERQTKRGYYLPLKPFRLPQ